MSTAHRGRSTKLAVRLVVAVTDRDWFEHLRTKPDLAEVNFWAPSGSSFKALQPGELFLFKLHAPHNIIVGGGVFAYANTLPCSLAWEAFGEANGARTLSEMRARIARYRRTDPHDRSDFPIGCRILTQPFFLPEARWIPVPESWSPNIVSFKGYSTGEADGRRLWDAVQDAVTASGPGEQLRYGEPVLVPSRLGQGAFRVLVTDIYERRCAITGERTLPILDAAHIKPYAAGGEHEPSNGLLLRTDIHRLFDLGYVTVAPDGRFEVSHRLKADFDNGRHYYDLQGTSVRTPQRAGMRPSAAALEWHRENRYLG
jgi:putative restriction endonuclease